MSHVPHELAEDFPDLAARIQTMKAEDSHFARLTDEYHDLNRDIHRAETNVEPTDDFHMEDMRRRRMVLKDTLYAMLKAD